MRSTAVNMFVRHMALLAAATALAGTPVQAGPGGGGGSTSGTTFSVEVAAHPAHPDTSGASLWVPLNGSSPCRGWSAGTSVPKPDYTARWRVDGVHLDCQDLTTSTGAQLTDDIVAKVSLNSSGKVVSVRISGQDVIGAAGLLHRSDPMIVAPTDPRAGGFTIHVHATDVRLWKCNTHLLGKQTTCNVPAGTFSLDDMIYTPNATSTSIEATIRYAPTSEPQ